MAAVRPTRTGALLVGLVALVAVVRLPSFTHQLYDPDEAAIAAEAIALRDGGTMYVDAVDRKPPLAVFAYEGAFRLTGSTDLRWLHALAAAALAGAAVVLALDTRRRHGEAAGWWAGVLLVLGAVGFWPADGQSANFAHLALLPGTLAMVWARRRGAWWPVAAGVALGVAILTRQSWVLGVVPGALGVGLSGEGVWAARAGRAATFVAATAATVAAIAVAVPFTDFWRWTFTNNGNFLSAGTAPGATAARFAATVGTFVLFHPVVVAVLAVALWAAIRARRLPDAAEADLWVWLLVGLGSVVAGLRFFGHYWLQALPPAVALAAPAAARLQGRWRTAAVVAVAVPAVGALAAAWTPTTFRTNPDVDRMATYVRAHSEPGDTVWVWGSLPDLLWAADRPPGGGQVHSDFVTGRSGGRDPDPSTIVDATPGAEDEMLAALRRHRPALVVDTSPAAIRQYDHYPLSGYPRLHRFLLDGYQPVATIDGVVIWAPKAR
jgi:4-amino-4-deoxy-L-arabinose transferase-like glycosyltransferase